MTRAENLRLRRLVLPLAALLLLVPPLYLWWSLLSPWGYVAPPGLPPYTEGPHAVFVYGTLRQPLVRRVVTGRQVEGVPAVLPGYRKTGLDLSPAPGESVAGERIRVSTPELRRLDRYERLGIRYDRVRLPLADGSEAWVYRRVAP
ncbi:MAG: hypothetical protein CME40_05395 [Haliea sp.]|nr:hypothetical protein [Haliea sp.]|tara:strand:+ start:98598 stop:99035 length:438 start_codon:yes stop_codon:yes gene_type:complete